MSTVTPKAKKENRALLLFTTPGRNNEPVEQAIPVKGLYRIGPAAQSVPFAGDLPEGVKAFITHELYSTPVHTFEDVKTLVDRVNRDDVHEDVQKLSDIIEAAFELANMMERVLSLKDVAEVIDFLVNNTDEIENVIERIRK